MTQTLAATKEHIREYARKLGFSECAVTTSDLLGCGATLTAWLEQGRHGQMDYLARSVARRTEPRLTMPDARSVVVVALAYPPGPPVDPRWRETLTGRIAAYARGADYHRVMAARLTELGDEIAHVSGSRFEVHVDSGPLVEKELARRAGLGWYGRNTNLLTKRLGSYLLLGCVLTDLDLEPDPPFTEEHCGECRACVPACPTGALDTGPTIDARRCISYLTIELRGPIPHSLRPLVSNWVFGCDDCQSVCPWNSASEANAFLTPSLLALLRTTESEFDARYGGTAIARIRRRGLARNAAIALGNSENPDAIPMLGVALAEDPEPIVRAAAAWALGRIGTLAARLALDRADRAAEIPPVAAEIRAALESAGDSDVVSPHAAVGVV